jgi:hypothetical protein
VSVARVTRLEAVSNGRAPAWQNRSRSTSRACIRGNVGELPATRNWAGQDMLIVETCCDMCVCVCVFAVVHLESPVNRHLELRNGPLTPSTCALHVRQPIHPLYLPQISMLLSLLSTLKILYFAAIGAWTIHLSRDIHRLSVFGRSPAAVAPTPAKPTIIVNACTAAVSSSIDVLPTAALRSSTFIVANTAKVSSPIAAFRGSGTA